MSEWLSDLGLDEDEKILWSGKPTLASLSVILLIIFLWWTIIIPILAVLRVRSMRYVLTNKRVWFKVGVIGKTIRTIPWGSVTDVTFHKGLFGRLIGCGDVYFQTAGSPHPEIVFWAVKEPEKVYKIAEKMIRT